MPRPRVYDPRARTTFVGVQHYVSVPGEEVHQFRGIVYADVRERFRQGVLKEVYSDSEGGEVDCSSFGPIAPQPPKARKIEEFVYGLRAEDVPRFAYEEGFMDLRQDEGGCLNLNVTRPACADEAGRAYVEFVQGQGGALKEKPKLLPVMIWVHGGGNVSGSGSDWITDPGRLVQRSAKLGKPCIVVSFNYRLGILGFAANAALVRDNMEATDGSAGALGNYTLNDQRLLYTWVHLHIAAFGGDPQNVTLFGSSWGATDIHCWLLSARAERWVRRCVERVGRAEDEDGAGECCDEAGCHATAYRRLQQPQPAFVPLYGIRRAILQSGALSPAYIQDLPTASSFLQRVSTAVLAHPDGFRAPFKGSEEQVRRLRDVDVSVLVRATGEKIRPVQVEGPDALGGEAWFREGWRDLRVGGFPRGLEIPREPIPKSTLNSPFLKVPLTPRQPRRRRAPRTRTRIPPSLLTLRQDLIIGDCAHESVLWDAPAASWSVDQLARRMRAIVQSVYKADGILKVYGVSGDAGEAGTGAGENDRDEGYESMDDTAEAGTGDLGTRLVSAFKRNRSLKSTSKSKHNSNPHAHLSSHPVRIRMPEDNDDDSTVTSTTPGELAHAEEEVETEVEVDETKERILEIMNDCLFAWPVHLATLAAVQGGLSDGHGHPPGAVSSPSSPSSYSTPSPSSAPVNGTTTSTTTTTTNQNAIQASRLNHARASTRRAGIKGPAVGLGTLVEESGEEEEGEDEDEFDEEEDESSASATTSAYSYSSVSATSLLTSSDGAQSTSTQEAKGAGALNVNLLEHDNAIDVDPNVDPLLPRVYRYVFDQASPYTGSPHHAVDLLYLFGNIAFPGEREGEGEGVVENQGQVEDGELNESNDSPSSTISSESEANSDEGSPLDLTARIQERLQALGGAPTIKIKVNRVNSPSSDPDLDVDIANDDNDNDSGPGSSPSSSSHSTSGSSVNLNSNSDGDADADADADTDSMLSLMSATNRNWDRERVRDAMQERWVAFAGGEGPWMALSAGGAGGGYEFELGRGQGYAESGLDLNSHGYHLYHHHAHHTHTHTHTHQHTATHTATHTHTHTHTHLPPPPPPPNPTNKIYIFGPEGETGERSSLIFSARRRVGKREYEELLRGVGVLLANKVGVELGAGPKGGMWVGGVVGGGAPGGVRGRV